MWKHQETETDIPEKHSEQLFKLLLTSCAQRNLWFNLKLLGLRIPLSYSEGFWHFPLNNNLKSNFNAFTQ